MNDFQAIADRVEIEALRAEYTDAVMMRDRARLASLFTPDGVLSMPNVPVKFTGPQEILDGSARLQEQWDFFVQTTHAGAVELDGDTASGRAYMHEIVRLRNGLQGINHAVYHDRYHRAAQGWKFAERVYEIRYLDLTPLTGSAPGAPGSAGASAVAAGAGPAGAPAAVPGAVGHAASGADDVDAAAEALAAKGFTVEILDDAAAARARVRELIPERASVFTAASETLRLSGIDDDLNAGDRYRSAKARALKLDRATESEELRRLVAVPDFVVGSVAALTRTGSLVAASASGSQLPAYAGGAACAIWIVGAQKVVPDLPAALRRVEEHALPLENARAQEVYGQPSAVNQLLVINAPARLCRGIVLLLRESIGF